MMKRALVVVLIAVLIAGGTSAMAVVGASKPPAAPTNPGTSSIQYNSITWTWGMSSTADGYHTYAQEGATPPAAVTATVTPKQTTSWLMGSLSPNTQYCFQVDAYNSDGSSAKTSTITAYTLQAVPGIPSIVSVGVDSIGVSTSGPVNLHTGSSGVIFNVNGSDRVKIKALDEAVTGLAANTQYTFKAKAANAAGAESGYSGATSKYTLAANPVFALTGAGAIAASVSSGGTCVVNTSVQFTAVNGFGPGALSASRYRYVWNNDAAEPDWASASIWATNGLQFTPTTPGTYFLHLQALNAEDAANPTTLLGTYYFTAIPEPSGLLALMTGIIGLVGMMRRRR